MHPDMLMTFSRFARAFLACAIFFPAVALEAAQLPTDGYVTYANTYSVQNWTTNVGSGYTLSNGVAITIVQYGDQRCELRWQNWPNQNTYNQFEFDEMFSPQTQNTAVHQIKSNTGGEVIYLQVQSPGTLRNDNGSVFATGMAGAFYHVNSMFNPDTGDAKCYINGALKVTRNYPTTDRFWYFKCGCYNNGLPPGGISTAWTKNFTNWVYLTNPPPTPTHLTAAAKTGQVNLTWFPSPGCTNYFLQRSTSSGSGYSPIATILGTTTTNYTDSAVVNGTTYYYVVSAANVFGQSGNSSQVSATPIDLGFQLLVSPSLQTVNAGYGTNYTVTVTTNSNFNGTTISLGIAGLPTGANANFSPQTLSAAGTSTLTINTISNTPGGNFLLTVAGTNSGFALTTTATLAVNGVSANPGPLIWSGTGGDTNWSTILNWTNTVAGGNGPPGPANNLQFTNSATSISPTTINNVVDANFTVGSLQFANNAANTSPNFHVTQINSGQTLISTNGLVVGTATDAGANQVVNAVITGAGGALILSNGIFAVTQGSGTDGAHQAVLDLSGLDTLDAVNISKLGVAVYQLPAQAGNGGQRSSGILYLAKTNFISTTSTGVTNGIVVGYNDSSGNGNSLGVLNAADKTSALFLGQNNTIDSDAIYVGTDKTLGSLLAFNPNFNNSSAIFRNRDGVSRVSLWGIGDTSMKNNSNQSCSGTNDFSGGNVDILVNNVTIGVSETGTSSGDTGDGTGVLTFDTGTIDANNLTNGWSVGTGTNGTDLGIGTVNVNGTATLNVNNNFAMAQNTSTGAGVPVGTLNLNGGTVNATNIFGGSGVSTINLNSGTLNLLGDGQIANISTLNVGANAVDNSALLQNAANVSVLNSVVIAANGTIAGDTSITSPGLTVDGTIAPGNNSAGVITNNGPATLGAGGHFLATVQDATAGAVTGWSFLQVNGAMDAQSSAASPFTISVQTPNAPAANFNYNTNFDWIVATASGGISNFDPTKVTVDASQFANDLAGGYFYVRLAGNSLVLSFTNNHPPVAAQFTVLRTGNVTTIPISMLATHWSDPDGDPVELTNVAGSSLYGVNNVGSDPANIYYTNSGAPFDSFIYTITDIRTNPPAIYQPGDTIQTGTGVVNILSQAPSLQNAAVTASGFAFSGNGGVPNGIYYLLTSTNAALPAAEWSVVATNSFDVNGNINLTNGTNPSQPDQFYLLKIP